MLDAVENHRAHSHLAGVRLAARLGGDNPRQQVDVAAAELALPGAAADAQRAEGFGAGNAVGGQAVVLLKGGHGLACLFAVNTVDLVV